MSPKMTAVGISLLIFFVVMELIRRERMTFKYALAWLAASAASLLFAFFDGLLTRLAAGAGFALPSNFIFFLVSVFTVFLGLLLTLFANDAGRKNEILAQKVAHLEDRLNQLQGKGESPN